MIWFQHLDISCDRAVISRGRKDRDIKCQKDIRACHAVAVHRSVGNADRDGADLGRAARCEVNAIRPDVGADPCERAAAVDRPGVKFARCPPAG